MSEHAIDGPRAQGDTHFEFLVIERPTDTANANLRRQIRSHVTRLQHRRNPRKKLVTAGATAGTVTNPKKKKGVDSSEKKTTPNV